MTRLTETVTITVDILRSTEKGLFVSDGDTQVWLPVSQIECAGEPGDTTVDIEMPEWLALEKGLI